MSTVCEIFGTNVRLVRKVRFDSVNEFDSEMSWLFDGPSKASTFTFRARVGIDTGVNSSPLFNMIAHITHKANDPSVSFRFFRPAHVNGMRKFQSLEVFPKDGFVSVNLNMTFLGQDGTEKFTKNFSSTMNTCGVDCSCMSGNKNKLPCHTVEAFCPVEAILGAMCLTKLNPSPAQYTHLYVVFDMRLTGRDSSSYWSPNLEPLPNLTSLSNTMKKMLESSTLSDVSLKVGGQTFKAHMTVLAGHSDVFAAMFDTDMKEKIEQTVTIDDITPGTLEILLKYLYYRDLKDIHENTQIAVDLLFAADKYHIQDLIQTCEEILLAAPSERFTMATALEAYLCGYRLGIPAIARHAIKVLKSKTTEVQDSECFRKFWEINVELVPHMFCILAIPEQSSTFA